MTEAIAGETLSTILFFFLLIAWPEKTNKFPESFWMVQVSQNNARLWPERISQ
jgi:hypothetical protein